MHNKMLVVLFYLFILIILGGIAVMISNEYKRASAGIPTFTSESGLFKTPSHFPDTEGVMCFYSEAWNYKKTEGGLSLSRASDDTVCK